MKYKEIAARVAALEFVYDGYGFSDAFENMQAAIDTFCYGLLNFPRDIVERLQDISADVDADSGERTEAAALLEMIAG